MDDSDFWTLYLREHSHPGSRWLHAFGTLISIVLLFSSWYFGKWWLALLAPVTGYGMAWTSHAVIERNRPLSMRYPIRSFLADYRLTYRMLMNQPLEHNPHDDESTGGTR